MTEVSFCTLSNWIYKNDITINYIINDMKYFIKTAYMFLIEKEKKKNWSNKKYICNKKKNVLNILIV